MSVLGSGRTGDGVVNICFWRDDTLRDVFLISFHFFIFLGFRVTHTSGFGALSSMAWMMVFRYMAGSWVRFSHWRLWDLLVVIEHGISGLSVDLIIIVILSQGL